MTAPDYGYYAGVYMGTMGEADFSRLSRRAAAYLDALTLGRASAPQPPGTAEKLREACCAVADAYLLNEQGGGIAAESNDGLSVTYVAGVSKAKTDGQRLYEAAELYLAHTGLLYRGV